MVALYEKPICVAAVIGKVEARIVDMHATEPSDIVTSLVDSHSARLAPHEVEDAYVDFGCVDRAVGDGEGFDVLFPVSEG